MHTDFIIVNEYCQRTNMDPSFFVLLEEGGLINTYIEEGIEYFPSSQLHDLERYSRMYYDLSINIEGIEAIHHMLNRMENLQKELDMLRSRLRLYESDEY